MEVEKLELRGLIDEGGKVSGRAGAGIWSPGKRQGGGSTGG